MPPGIRLQRTLSRTMIGESAEQQLLYVLLEATPEGIAAQLPKLPLNLCLVLDRSSSMRGDRLNQVKDAAGRIIDQLSQDDYFALVVFNDRADVVVQSQRATNRADLKQALGRIEASGGTEMANGMAMALQEIQRPMISRGISRMLLLTDGRTYGDESRCVDIARRAQQRGIGLTALGVGSEWNEDLLETMTARENSRAHYIASASDITSVFADELKRLHSIFAQQVGMQIAARPGGLVRSVDRVRPFIAPVAISEEADLRWSAGLGDWPGSDVHAFLIEVVTPPLSTGDHPLLKITVRYDLQRPWLSRPGGRRDRAGWRARQQAGRYQVDSTVKYWLERLVAYRLQSSAWQDVEAGRLDEATRRLQMAGTRLFEAGEVALAHQHFEKLAAPPSTSRGRPQADQIWHAWADGPGTRRRARERKVTQPAVGSGQAATLRQILPTAGYKLTTKPCKSAQTAILSNSTAIFCAECGANMFAPRTTMSLGQRGLTGDLIDAPSVAPAPVAMPAGPQITLVIMNSGRRISLDIADDLLIGRKDNARGSSPTSTLASTAGTTRGYRAGMPSWRAATAPIASRISAAPTVHL
ncbi:MAG: VWA domain-containing protein [Kouleothrix sp.]